jgi:hypothetical protein
VGGHRSPLSADSGSIDFDKQAILGDKQAIFGKEIGGGRLFPGDASRAAIACDNGRRR